MVDDKDNEIRRLRERLDALEAPSAAPVQPAKPKNKAAQVGCAVVALLGVMALLSLCTQGGGSSGTSTSPSTPTWSPPAGYDRHETRRGGFIGVEWEQPTRAECRGSGVTCFAMNVVTEAGCERALYVSITLLDDAGNNIGWTNDTARGVQPGERTRLVFDTYERGVKSARIAEASCY